MKTSNIKNLFKELYGLNDTEIKCFLKCYKEREVSIQKIAKYVKKDITYVSRCLKKLMNLGLLSRESRCCTRGKRGRYWIYYPISKSKIKRILREHAKKLYTKHLKMIRRI